MTPDTAEATDSPFGSTTTTTTRTYTRRRPSMPLLMASLGTLLMSIPLIVMGSWLAWRSTYADCLPFLHIPLLVLGCVLLVVSLIGMAAAVTHNPPLTGLYIFITLLVFLTLLAFTIFTFAVTDGGQHGHGVSGADYREYRLSDYSTWMRDRVSARWADIKGCLKSNHVCTNLAAAYSTQAAFNSHLLSYIESGCCKPPSSCHYTFVTATNWVNATTSTPSNDKDCGRWSNDQSQLCYNCNSCKAGVIRTVNKDWLKAAKLCIPVLFVTFLLLLFSFMGLPATFRRTTRTSTYGHPHPQPRV